MKIIEGGVTTPKGFKATGNFVGIKKEKKDLMLLATDRPAVAAAVFTTNKVKAAPVVWDEKIISDHGKIKGIITNSGNANACTGTQGYADTEKMAECFADTIQAKKEEILVCSTGVIGVNLPIDIIIEGINKTHQLMGYSPEDGINAAEAISTTDTYIKIAAVEINLSGKTVTIGGMAKGSGMIHPNMATMLAYVTTDAGISRELLDKALKASVLDSYNMISVDGDTSTNDTVLVLANGMAENKMIEVEDEDYAIFKEALHYVNKKLSIDVARDGEGATKLMEVTVTGAKTKQDARTIARGVTSSNLFKAALFGADANWGRVLCAMGYSGGDFNPEDVTIVFKSVNGEIELMKKGRPIVFDEAKAAEILKEKDILIDVQLNEGSETATAWGCDLTYDYVKINGDYRS